MPRGKLISRSSSIKAVSTMAGIVQLPSPLDVSSSVSHPGRSGIARQLAPDANGGWQLVTIWRGSRRRLILADIESSFQLLECLDRLRRDHRVSKQLQPILSLAHSRSPGLCRSKAARALSSATDAP
jgi:hypothetical protein